MVWYDRAFMETQKFKENTYIQFPNYHCGSHMNAFKKYVILKIKEGKWLLLPLSLYLIELFRGKWS